MIELPRGGVARHVGAQFRLAPISGLPPLTLCALPPPHRDDIWKKTPPKSAIENHWLDDCNVSRKKFVYYFSAASYVLRQR
jgi:hypothetical protein